MKNAFSWTYGPRVAFGAAALAVVAAVSLACGGVDHPANGAHGAHVLRLVPDDTPYVFASLEPASREYLERTLRDAGPRTAKALAKLHDMGFDSKGPAAKVFVTVLEDLSGNLSAEGLDRIGVGTSVRGVIYGLGLIPVMRWELKDGAAFKAFLTSAITRSGVQVPVATAGGHEYWSATFGHEQTPFSLVIAVIGNDFVALLAPQAALDRVLPLAFGDQVPQHSLADSTAFTATQDTYKLGAHGLGYVDFARLAAIGTDENDPARALLGPFAKMIPTQSPECKTEFTASVAVAPRLLFGIDELSATRTTGRLILELRPDIVAALSALRVSIPGLGAPLGDGVVAFGGGLDVPRAYDFVRAKLAILHASPYRCPLLADVNKAVDELNRDLAQPIPGWLSEIRGGALVLQDLDVSGGFDIKAYAIVAAADPLKLIDLAKRLLPPLAGLNLSPDGKAVKLPGNLAPMLPATYVAMKGQTLGVAMGDGQDATLVSVMAAPPAAGQPFFAFSFNPVRWNKVIAVLGDSFSSMIADEDNAGVSSALLVAPHGLEVDFSVTRR